MFARTDDDGAVRLVEATARTQRPWVLVLVGPSGSGKSTFAKTLVERGVVDAGAVIATDEIRAELCGDASDQSRNDEVFALRHQRLLDRLSAGLPVVVDATNLDPSRGDVVAAAGLHHAVVVAVRFAVPLAECHRRNAARSRVVPAGVLDRQYQRAERISAETLRAEGVRAVIEVSARQESYAR